MFDMAVSVALSILTASVDRGLCGGVIYFCVAMSLHDLAVSGEL